MSDEILPSLPKTEISMQSFLASCIRDLCILQMKHKMLSEMKTRVRRVSEVMRIMVNFYIVSEYQPPEQREKLNDV